MTTTDPQPVTLSPEGRPTGFLQQVTDFSSITLHVDDDGIATIRLNRPSKLNAFDEEMIREIRSAIWRANFDQTIRVVVITGAGRGFCAGRDIPGLQYENGLPSPQYRAYVRANHEMFDDFEALEKPIIAAVNGVCAGGGVEMAISCDLRVAVRGATFVLPELNIGVIPASGVASRMIQMVGIGRVKELMMTAEPIDAEEAFRIGLVNRLADDADELRQRTAELARVLARRAPLALGMAKHIVNICQNVDTETGRALERLGQSVLVSSEDAREGVRAFQEKRPPRFGGR